ncbi:DUF3429 domain-containing protein [Parvularcula sp. IMCC14364]|uniref:DUF3429 domain-containing protein n=1 Tax=Parvularcula sp. IMCC14364 TaxID=3067902 RepID=UPI0027422A94|nr:DUF3429 domain-containing protein [Parvularcula sp. IMCC14364]
MTELSNTAKPQAPMGPLEERATWLAYAGLLPFLGTAFYIWFSPLVFPANYAYALLRWELLYGAIILSFMGGIRWGLAMLNNKTISEYVTLNQLTNSVIPPLVGWLAVIPANLIPGIAPTYVVRHLVLLIAFVLLMQADRNASRDGFAPAWYGPLRLKITMFLSLIFILSMMRMMSLGW